jgi:hypothetical protein
MTLIVAAPPTYEPERRYILEVVMSQWLGLDWELRLEERSGVRITVGDDGAPGHVILPDGLFATEERGWLTAASLPPSPVPWLPSADAQPAGAIGVERLPVLYGDGAASSALVFAEGPGVRLCVDVFGSAFFMLTRYEEVAVAARDSFGRFPAAASVALREGFLGLPIVDAYVELLWSALHRLWPRLRRRQRRFAVALTHDVDHPLAFLGRSAGERLRQLGADVLVRRDASLAGRRLRSWTGIRRGDYRLDPYNTFDFLMEVSERLGVASSFYFLATRDTTPLNGFYTLQHPWIRALMARIHERGHELGFHAGFDTYRDAERTTQEFNCLRTTATELGVSPSRWGGRQHYLRWENPGTWSNWERAGLDYDSTLGFAEIVGFRAGTCHEFRPFHLRDRRPLDLAERPLHVMDTTLFEYMKLTPAQALEAVLEVARACRRVQGTLTLLWHNSMLPTAAQRRWYEALTGAVTSL